MQSHKFDDMWEEPAHYQGIPDCRKVAEYKTTVLVEGESGTGKELAHYIDSALERQLHS